VCVGKESSKVQCPLLCTAAATAAVLVFPLVSVGYCIYYYSDIPKGKKKSGSERVQLTEPAGTALAATAPVGLLIFNKELLLAACLVSRSGITYGVAAAQRPRHKKKGVEVLSHINPVAHSRSAPAQRPADE